MLLKVRVIYAFQHRISCLFAFDTSDAHQSLIDLFTRSLVHSFTALLTQSNLEACCARKFETRRSAIQEATRREEELARGGHEEEDDDELDWFGDSRCESYMKDAYCILERPQTSPTARVRRNTSNSSRIRAL